MGDNITIVAHATDVELPKWPGLVVWGEDVTPEQAQEILVRTNDAHLFTNDKAFLKQVVACLGVPVNHDKKEEYSEYYARKKCARDALGILDLAYIKNNRIASCWVGGPHGWCDWDGKIGCHNYNIGKWPTSEEVVGEWADVAAAFPYLKLTAVLMSEENSSEYAAEPLIVFHVSDGKVVVTEPSETFEVVRRDDCHTFKDVLGKITLAPRNERGVTIEKLKQAVAYTKKRLFEDKN